ncbi:hypothetical protein BRC80_11455, partial [Halobacteriales archaeon QH_9_66_26]
LVLAVDPDCPISRRFEAGDSAAFDQVDLQTSDSKEEKVGLEATSDEQLWDISDEVLEAGLDPLEEPAGIGPEPGGVQDAAVGGPRELLSHIPRRVGAVLGLS